MTYIKIGFFIGILSNFVFGLMTSILTPIIMVTLDTIWVTRISGIEPDSEEEDQHIGLIASFITGLIGFYPGLVIGVLVQLMF